MSVLDRLKFDAGGLITAVARDLQSGRVLMVAFMNREALEKTLQTRKAHYYSRSRKKLWLKGETSGHFQFVQHLYVDCDGDAVLMDVVQEGAACHEGYFSCFYREIVDAGADWKIIDQRVFDPEKVY